MRVDFQNSCFCRGGGGGKVCSLLAGSGLGVSVGAFVPRLIFLAATVPGI